MQEGLLIFWKPSFLNSSQQLGPSFGQDKVSEFLDDFGVDLLDILQFDGYEAELGDEGVKGLKKGE